MVKTHNKHLQRVECVLYMTYIIWTYQISWPRPPPLDVSFSEIGDYDSWKVSATRSQDLTFARKCCVSEVKSRKRFNDPKQVFEENAFNEMESGKRFSDQKQVFEKNSFKKLCLFHYCGEKKSRAAFLCISLLNLFLHSSISTHVNSAVVFNSYFSFPRYC